MHGAAFLDGKKIVVGMTARGKDADKFWFSLFHELAHIVIGHIGQLNGTTEDDEKKADMWPETSLYRTMILKDLRTEIIIQRKACFNLLKSKELLRGLSSEGCRLKAL